MYEERRETVSIKEVLLHIVLIVLFVLLLLWIFPTKGYVRNLFNKKDKDKEVTTIDASVYDLDKFAVLYNRIFADNLYRMKETAISYYTNERLPKNVGDTEKMTLSEMYDKHLLLKLTDKDGNECDKDKSYVSITKDKNEYRLKVNLSCGGEEDYIIIYLGCYDYCDDDTICEKQDEVKVVNKNSDKNKDKNNKSDKNKDKENSKDKDESKDENKDNEDVCEYNKYLGGFYGDYGEWSKWSKEKVTSNFNTYVETKSKNEIVGYNKEKVASGTKLETYVKDVVEEKYVVETKEIKELVGYEEKKELTGYDVKKVVVDYITKKVKVGTEKVQVGTTTQTVVKKVPSHTANIYEKSGSGTTIPSNGNGYVYVKTGSKTVQTCSSCTATTVYTWDVYKVVTVYTTKKVTEEVPVYDVRDVYEDKKVPVYGVEKTPIYETKKVPVYKTVKKEIYGVREVEVYGTREVPVYTEVDVPIYDDVIYYRYKTRNYFGGTKVTKWSTCDPTDKDLIEEGFILTGNKKEA